MRFSALFLLSLLVLLPFQNCGAPIYEQGQINLSSSDFFAYPYFSQPDFYYEIQLLRPASQESGLSSFKLFATAVSAEDPSRSISYEVAIKTKLGDTLCPLTRGTLYPGQTTITFDCVTMVSSNNAIVQLRLNDGTKSIAVSKSY